MLKNKFRALQVASHHSLTHVRSVDSDQSHFSTRPTPLHPDPRLHRIIMLIISRRM
ncbi:Hypothetical protein FKW44_015129 [Caligus rogercresseyi]|uniref:Uncharacterized protein n=1 Tax=Caligus rogercresseyi TaxID=217165 RepID=A0A7T8GZW1_CALRO|nr:Hypothetical protein FKW44_015129 [Caligus rogercresseyi]